MPINNAFTNETDFDILLGLAPEEIERISGTSKKVLGLCHSPWLWRRKLLQHFAIEHSDYPRHQFWRLHAQRTQGLPAGAKALIAAVLEDRPYALDRYKEYVNIKTNEGDTMLVLAVRYNKLAAAKRLVELGADLKAKCKADQRSALHIAAELDKIEFIQYFCHEDKDAFEVLDSRGRNIFHVALECGHRQLVDALLELKPDILYSKDLEQRNALHIAVEAKQFPIFLHLLKLDNTLLFEKDALNRNVLHIAAFYGSIEAIYYIHALQPSFATDLDSQGSNVLHQAAKSGVIEVINFFHSRYPQLILAVNSSRRSVLIFAAEHGCNSAIAHLMRLSPDIISLDQEYTPLQAAVEHNQHDSVNLLYPHYENNQRVLGSCLVKAAAKGYVNIIDTLNDHYQAYQTRRLTDALLSSEVHSFFPPLPMLNTALVAAAVNSQLEAMRKLIQLGVDLNPLDQNQVPLLLGLLSIKAPDAAVNLLIEKGANVAYTIFQAVKADLQDVLSLLERLNYKLDQRDQNGNNAAFWAAKQNDFETLKRLSQQGIDINALLGKGETLLHIAAREDNFRLIEQLIALKADPGIYDQAGATALHSAIAAKANNAVYALLAHQVDVNVPDQYGFSPLYWAIHKNNPTAMELLHSKRAILRPLLPQNSNQAMLAVVSNAAASLEKLMQMGYDPLCRRPDGYSNLHLAAEAGAHSVVKILIAAGANVDSIVSACGSTPLHFAAEYGQLECIKALLDSGANMNLSDHNGHTPLQRAVLKKQNQVARKLLAHGAGYSNKDAEGNTVLHLAVRAANNEMIKCLAQYNISLIINPVFNADGFNPMHLAVLSHNIDSVRILRGLGASVNSKTSSGLSCLDLVGNDNGATSILYDVLCEYGASAHKRGFAHVSITEQDLGESSESHSKRPRF